MRISGEASRLGNEHIKCKEPKYCNCGSPTDNSGGFSQRLCKDNWILLKGGYVAHSSKKENQHNDGYKHRKGICRSGG